MVWLRNVDVVKSPDAAERVRLIGEVSYSESPRESELYWFDVPAAYADSLTMSGNPWVGCLVSLAATLGEPLRISRPVDPTLYANVQRLMRIWKGWYPHLHVVPIEGELQAVSTASPEKTAAFFTAGLDSFYTVLQHERMGRPGGDGGTAAEDAGAARAGGGSSGGETRNARSTIDELIWIWGWFDVLPRADRTTHRRIRSYLQRAAEELGKELVDVESNLRETRWRLTDYVRLSHGSATASVGLALENRYGEVLIPSSEDVGPYGSHPATDPLLSTSRTRVVCDGAGTNRIAKTEVVARSGVAMRYLRVCYHSFVEANCGSCAKCLRVMATLACLGALEGCTTFPAGALDLKRIEKTYCQGKERHHYRTIAALATTRGRSDIARAMNRSVRWSSLMERVLTATRRFHVEAGVRRGAKVLGLEAPLKRLGTRVVGGPWSG